MLQTPKGVPPFSFFGIVTPFFEKIFKHFKGSPFNFFATELAKAPKIMSLLEQFASENIPSLSRSLVIVGKTL